MLVVDSGSDSDAGVASSIVCLVGTSDQSSMRASESSSGSRKAVSEITDDSSDSSVSVVHRVPVLSKSSCSAVDSSGYPDPVVSMPKSVGSARGSTTLSSTKLSVELVVSIAAGVALAAGPDVVVGRKRRHGGAYCLVLTALKRVGEVAAES